MLVQFHSFNNVAGWWNQMHSKTRNQTTQNTTQRNKRQSTMIEWMDEPLKEKTKAQNVYNETQREKFKREGKKRVSFVPFFI